MHEKARRLVDAMVAALTDGLPGELTRVDVFTDADVSRQFSQDKFEAAVASAVEREFGVAEFIPEPSTHNERSARRQAVHADRDAANVFVPGDEPRTGHYARNPEAVSHEAVTESENGETD